MNMKIIKYMLKLQN